MDNRLNPKVCYFCNQDSEKKMTIHPLTKILTQIYLTAEYQGRNYPVCKACSQIWDAAINKINAVYEGCVDKLFEKMVTEGAKVKDGIREADKSAQ